MRTKNTFLDVVFEGDAGFFLVAAPISSGGRPGFRALRRETRVAVGGWQTVTSKERRGSTEVLYYVLYNSMWVPTPALTRYYFIRRDSILLMSCSSACLAARLSRSYYTYLKSIARQWSNLMEKPAAIGSVYIYWYILYILYIWKNGRHIQLYMYILYIYIHILSPLVISHTPTHAWLYRSSASGLTCLVNQLERDVLRVWFCTCQ